MMPEEVKAFAAEFLSEYTPASDGVADVGFAPPFTSLAVTLECFAGTPGIRIGAQNVHWRDSGAHTGEVSVPMLKELGVDFVIVGHSERRQYYGESDDHVALRAKAAITQSLTAVVCIGETREEFEAGKTADVVDTQIKGSLNGLTPEDTENLVIAYEPVWAIGTGLAATPEIASGVHDQIRKKLCGLFGDTQGSSIPILYGGSTKPDNVGPLLANREINGALVGGASLKPDMFNQLIKNGRAAKLS